MRDDTTNKVLMQRITVHSCISLINILIRRDISYEMNCIIAFYNIYVFDNRLHIQIRYYKKTDRYEKKIINHSRSR